MGGNYADNGEINTEPNGIELRVWNATHSESGAPVKLKFYAIQQFEAGKVVLLNEWFDPSSMESDPSLPRKQLKLLYFLLDKRNVILI